MPNMETQIPKTLLYYTAVKLNTVYSRPLHTYCKPKKLTEYVYICGS